MTRSPEYTAAQEPGIGGPVDLAGIKRYQRVRIVAVLVLAVGASVATAMALVSRPDWNGGSASQFDLPANAVIMHAYFAAFIVLMATEAGNVTESWLAVLGALWFALMGALALVGIAAALAVLVPEWPGWLRLSATLFAGFAVMVPPALVDAWITYRRCKRLEAVEGGDT